MPRSAKSRLKSSFPANRRSAAPRASVSPGSTRTAASPATSGTPSGWMRPPESRPPWLPAQASEAFVERWKSENHGREYHRASFVGETLAKNRDYGRVRAFVPMRARISAERIRTSRPAPAASRVPGFRRLHQACDVLTPLDGRPRSRTTFFPERDIGKVGGHRGGPRVLSRRPRRARDHPGLPGGIRKPR